jgi:hypothetical protein
MVIFNFHILKLASVTVMNQMSMIMAVYQCRDVMDKISPA